MNKAVVQKQGEHIKELKVLSGNNDPDIFKSDLSEYFYSFHSIKNKNPFCPCCSYDDPRG
jgi:hypothetical protein